MPEIPIINLLYHDTKKHLSGNYQINWENRETAQNYCGYLVWCLLPKPNLSSLYLARLALCLCLRVGCLRACLELIICSLVLVIKCLLTEKNYCSRILAEINVSGNNCQLAWLFSTFSMNKVWLWNLPLVTWEEWYYLFLYYHEVRYFSPSKCYETVIPKQSLYASFLKLFLWKFWLAHLSSPSQFKGILNS